LTPSTGSNVNFQEWLRAKEPFERRRRPGSNTSQTSTVLLPETIRARESAMKGPERDSLIPPQPCDKRSLLRPGHPFQLADFRLLESPGDRSARRGGAG